MDEVASWLEAVEESPRFVWHEGQWWHYVNGELVEWDPHLVSKVDDVDG